MSSHLLWLLHCDKLLNDPRRAGARLERFQPDDERLDVGILRREPRHRHHDVDAVGRAGDGHGRSAAARRTSLGRRKDGAQQLGIQRLVSRHSARDRFAILLVHQRHPEFLLAKQLLVNPRHFAPNSANLENVQQKLIKNHNFPIDGC